MLRWWSPCSGIWGTRATPPPSYWLGEYLILQPVVNLFAMDFFYHFIYQFLQTTSLFLKKKNNNNSSDQTLIRPIRLTN